jgi:ferrous iron transport protein B
MKPPWVALVGPPNSGKTTLFNALTGSRSRSVNYPGSTVEYTMGSIHREGLPPLLIADTPGTYSLAPKSPDETVTNRLLFGELEDRPKGVVVVIDGTQLERQCILVRQLVEARYTVVAAVTMQDLVKESGQRIDARALESALGVSVFPLSANEGSGVEALLKGIHSALDNATAPAGQPPAWSAQRIEFEQKAAFGIAKKALIADTAVPTSATSPAEWTRAIDRWLLHPVFGLVFFFSVMGLLFTSVFWVAAPLMDFVSGFFDQMAFMVLRSAPGALWADFVGGGLLLSAGAILTFVPQIIILFVGITLLEDSGYLARAATLIDRPLGAIGLNGRSFVPLLSGYACAIPAMLAARSIPNRRERWVTLFIIPLMSCSARLPVYALLLAYLFWGEPAWKPGLGLTLIYVFSLLVGAIASALVSKLLPKEADAFFVLELPYYRKPSLQSLFRTVLLKTESYLRKAGPAIFAFSVLIWLGTTFPNPHASTPSEKMRTSYAARVGHWIDPVMAPMGGDWRTGISLVSAFAAREVFVSSLGLVLQVSESSEDEASEGSSLLAAMRTAQRSDGTALFTPASVIALILFFVIALQCMSTLAVARREFGSWKAPIAQLILFNLVAYAFAVGAHSLVQIWMAP